MRPEVERLKLIGLSIVDSIDRNADAEIPSLVSERAAIVSKLDRLTETERAMLAELDQRVLFRMKLASRDLSDKIRKVADTSKLRNAYRA